MRQKEYIGPGSIHKLRDILSASRAETVFLVSGTGSLASSGAGKLLEPVLAGRQVTHFSQFQTNPAIEDLKRGLALFERDKTDLVLAVGGGSVLDMAKMVNFFGSNAIDISAYVNSTDGGLAIGCSRPLVAVPTTSGSGSEATHFAVLYIDSKKHSIAHETILPEVAVVDPDLSRSMPPAVTASTGLDALCQAVESYWSIHSTEESKLFSRDAIRLITSNLEKAVKWPDGSSRAAMANAAHLAGKAINIAKTTAAHAMSYPLTSQYDIPHGHAVALTLPSLLKFNAGVGEAELTDPRGLEYVRKVIGELAGLLGAVGPAEAAEKIEHLIGAVGLTARIADFGAGQGTGMKKTIRAGFDSERAGNNPRRITNEAVVEILNG